MLAYNLLEFETLMTLVLPIYRHIAVIDGKKLEKSELEEKVFVREKGIGRSRVEVVCELLEMIC